MTDLQKQFQEEKDVSFDGIPINGVHLEYITWLEAQIQALRIHGVVVELPKVNSKDFKDWLKSEGYKNKGFGIYQKENKDYCYKLLYKHYCNILEFGN